MRILKVALFVAAFAAIMLSCSSLDKEALSSIDSVALVSVICDKNIGIGNFTQEASAIAIINALANLDDFNLDGQAAAVKDMVLREYSSILPFRFVEESEVLGNPDYKKIAEETAKTNYLGALVAPIGYCYYHPNTIGATTESQFINAFPEVGGFMMVSVNYELIKVGISIAGFGNAAVRASMLIKVIGRDGKTVMFVNEYAESDGTVPYVLGDIIDTKQIPPAVEQATERVRETVLAFLRKNLQ
jgi:hypothetical protein